MTNILFLDVDGVLNSDQWYLNRQARGIVEGSNAWSSDINPEAVRLLNELNERIPYKILLSSTWRLGYPLPILQERFRGLGLIPPLVGATPSITPTGQRGNEIQEALELINGLIVVDSYAILDDDMDMLPHQQDYFVRVDHALGLTQENTFKVEEIFNTKKLPIDA